MRFNDKVVVVHGGNSGIGLAAARQLVREGAHCIITGRDEATLKSAESELPGLRAHVVELAIPDSLDPVMEAVKSTYGRIDALLIASGVGKFQPIREVTPADWDFIHDVNLRGCFFAVQKALPLMREGGSIVLTGSVAASLGGVGGGAYAASKAGLRALTRSFAAELVSEGIRVNIMSPGPTDTPIFMRGGGDEAEVDAARKMFAGLVPMKRLGTPDEIAKAMLFLASDDASFITAIDLSVDGGMREL